MLWWKPLNHLKSHAVKISHAVMIPGIESSLKETMCAGIEITGGIALAFYTYKNCTSRIWPIMSSAIAVQGIFKVLTKIRKNYRRSTSIEREQIWSAWNLATGTVMYVTNVYAFSEALKRNDKLWVLCLGLAASGYYLVASSLHKLDRAFSRKIYLKCFQKMFEPTLISFATIYLLEFQNHQEGWLQWGPFAITAATGFKTAYFGFLRDEREEEPNTILLKWIEIVTGGCFLTLSCAVLTVYSSVNNYPDFWTAMMFSTSLCGLCVIYSSLELLMVHMLMDPYVFYSVVDMIIGSFVLFPAGILVLVVFNPFQVLHLFLVLCGTGSYLFAYSMRNLHRDLPMPEFESTCSKVLGPTITMYSSIVATYVRCRMGWRFSIPLMPFIFLGFLMSFVGFTKPLTTTDDTDDIPTPS